MSLLDVWRNLDKEVGIYYRNFENVPEDSGVYAWFYPLRVFTKDLDEFIADACTVYEFSNSTHTSVGFPWTKIDVDLEIKGAYQDSSDKFNEKWKSLLSEDDPDTTERFRKALLASTILLPPLYIGKANNLLRRCRQHLNSPDGLSCFKNRFEKFAAEKKLSIRQINKLVFVCVKIESIDDQLKDTPQTEADSLLEEILKAISRPTYGVK